MTARQDALDAVQYVRSQMKCVSLNRTCDTPDAEMGRRIGDKARKAEDKMAAINEGPYVETGAKARTTLKLRTGNCDELAALAFAYLAEKAGRTRPLEIFQVFGGDHAFVVIGRRDSRTGGDMTTWNADAVICDPWAEHVCSADALGPWLDKVSEYCLDKPADWLDFRRYEVPYMVGDKQYMQQRQEGSEWCSVKALRAKTKQVSEIRVGTVASLTAGTWPYKLTGQQ